MDQSTFDRIARLLGGATSRRTGLRAALGGVVGMALGGAASPGVPAAAAKKRGAPGKQGPCGDGSRKDNICSKDTDCCTGICNTRAGKKNKDGKGRCRCLRKGLACSVDANCCNGMTCSGGVCTPPCTPTVCATGCTFSTVQAAIDAASAGDTIVIGPGTYVEELTIDKALVLQGCPTATIKDTGVGHRTVSINVAAGSVELRNLTIDGTGNWNSGNPGGGISCMGGLILSGATTVTNGCANAGGGVFLEAESALVIKDTARIVNCGGTFGGGVYAATSSSVTMKDSSEISGNHAFSTIEGGGGGVWLGAATMTMSGASAIRNNVSDHWGGGVVLEYNAVTSVAASLTMTNASTITGNSSSSNVPSSGSGIWSSNVLNTATGTLTRVTGNTPDPQCAGTTCA